MRMNRVFKFRWYSNLTSFGANEQICYRLAVGQIKIGVFWSLPYSRFSAMCKEYYFKATNRNFVFIFIRNYLVSK
ncbi:hypothetical protein GQ457_15G022010 [Hibiscus cannabinus]